ncbi:MAG: amylo-alpha-1,6-glucosidase, partial [Polyangiaceae bacterium]|nr:amylo-alpha-1,6-glucosidase [Polyangiaceae bacterium]
MKPLEKISWQSPLDGPWPEILVNGDLENAENEWLMSNDIGAYSMSTVALMHTRRQHGLLVTPLDDPTQRYVVLSHLEMVLETGARQYKLSTHQFPGIAPTLGYRHLEHFSQDPLPRWVYRFPGGSLERTICLAPQERGLVIALTWSGKKKASLHLRPLMPMRAANSLSFEHGGMKQLVALRPHDVEMQPVAELPPINFQHQGVFMGSPDWWRKFEFLDDRGRYPDFQEDLWSPGLFELELKPKETQYLVVSVGGALKKAPDDVVMTVAQRQLSFDLSTSALGAIRSLAVTADSFVVAERRAIAAGYPWLEYWSRDELLSIPGLLLCRSRFKLAEEVLRRLIGEFRDGLLPRRTLSRDEDYQPCVDSSLLLFSIGAQVLASTDSEEFAQELFAIERLIFESIVAGTNGVARLNHALVEVSGEI